MPHAVIQADPSSGTAAMLASAASACVSPRRFEPSAGEIDGRPSAWVQEVFDAYRPRSVPLTRALRVLEERIQEVRCYAQFRLVLGLEVFRSPMLAASPVTLPSQRAALLAALGGRVMALSAPERVLAIRDFLSVDPGVLPHGLLRDVRAAACRGSAGLLQREQTLVAPGGLAHRSVASGQHVVSVARRLAISSADSLEALELAALPVAYRALAAGTSVPVVADGLGLHSVARRDQLERFATACAAAPAVRAGECPWAVAERLGIRSADCQRALRDEAARRDRRHAPGAHLAVPHQ